MESKSAERTPAVIAGEITAIKEQTRSILLVSAVEVGRRLTEAKEIIPYGQFGKWLEEAVDYSERVAYKLMRIAEEYGPQLPTASGADAQLTPLAKLGYSQAFALLGIPAAERAEFIADLDLENMSVSALRQAIQERDKAQEKQEELEDELDVHKVKIISLANERDRAKTEVDNKQKALWEEQGKSIVLQRTLTTLQDDSAAGRRFKELERERDVAKINQSMAQADARYDLIVKGFGDLFSVLGEMTLADPKALLLFLIQINEFMSITQRKLKRLGKKAAEEQAVVEAKDAADAQSTETP